MGAIATIAHQCLSPKWNYQIHACFSAEFVALPRRRYRLGASKQQALQARCDMGHRHDQDLAIEPNLAMSAASDATNST
jgi:hypothetical protein